MFFLSPLVCENLVCGAGAVDYWRGNDRGQDVYRVAAINFLPDTDVAVEGRLPWPSSFHRGGVNVVFADGRVQFLSESVDGRVYAALLSPQGTAISGPLAQRVVTATGD